MLKLHMDAYLKVTENLPEPAQFLPDDVQRSSLSPTHDSVSIPLVLDYLSYRGTADSKLAGDLDSLRSIFNL